MEIKVSSEDLDKILESQLAQEYYEDLPYLNVAHVERGRPDLGEPCEKRVLHLADVSFIEG